MVWVGMQIGTLTLAGMRELAEEAGEKKGSPLTAEETPKTADEPEAAAAAATAELADDKPADPADSLPQEEKKKPVPRAGDPRRLPNPPTPGSGGVPAQPVQVSHPEPLA